MNLIKKKDLAFELFDKTETQKDETKISDENEKAYSTDERKETIIGDYYLKDII